MLNTLYIENIAVIEKTTIDFKHGLNVLTGETGAGKSIIIDAINAIMGQRTSKDIIRTGETSAFVSAEFDEIGDTVKQKLSELGYEDEDGVVIIQRTLNQSGKSSCKINSRPATATVLKEITKHLINIHGQHENYELFSAETHIDYIDRYGECQNLIEAYKKEYKTYSQLKKKLNEAQSDEGERLREIDLLSYQTNELNDADVQDGEEDELLEERKSLMSFEKVSSLLSKAKMMLDGDDQFDGGVEACDIASNAVRDASEYNSEFSELSENLTDVFYNLKDCSETLNDMIDSLESDPQRLEEIEERLDTLNRLSRKYNCPIDELNSLAEKMQNRLNELLGYDKNRDELENSYKEAKNRAIDAAEKLSDKRKKAAKSFAKKVKEEMNFLDMPNVELVPNIEKTLLSPNGIDKIELLISANPGETPKPVAKIASGGELSRMMLAIKTVLASTDTIDTLIFDEIDTGISGSAAQKVGLKLKQVSENCQVFCVTHQAQIAGLADFHFLISKDIAKGRTFTKVHLLDHNGRVKELARIIGGINITEAALKHAEELLIQNTNG